MYSAGWLRQDTYSRGKMFPLFSPPFQKFFGANDTSFESPYIGRLESAKKWAWHFATLFIIIQALFLDFQIQQLAILKPVEVGRSYIPQKKALYHAV